MREGKWQWLRGGQGNAAYASAVRWRDRFLGILEKHLHTEREFAVGSALILGYRDAIPEEVMTAYSETGAMHLLAVSGMHVGFIFYFFSFFFKRIKRHTLPWRILRFVLPVTFIWAFALVTGASASVMRAAVMFTFLIAGNSLQRYTNIYNTLAASAFCLLLYNPYWLLDVGFQLSYLAVLGIVFFEPRITRLWLVQNKIVRFFWQVNSVSLAAQLMTLPLTLYYFHQFPTWFWLSSLVLVPVSGLVLGAGLVLFLVDGISSALAFGLGKALWGMVWFSNEVIAWIQKLPLSLLDGIWLPGWAVLALFLGIMAWMQSLSANKPRWVLAALGLLLVTGLNSAFTSWGQRGQRQIVAYHLSKATLVDFMDGERAWSLQSKDAPEKAIRFAAENHRMATGVKEVLPLELATDTTLQSGAFFYQSGFAQFHDKRLAFITAPLPSPGPSKIKVDYVLVSGGGSKLKVEDILEIFDCQELIFDGSNKFYRLEEWKQACGEAKVRCHCTSEEGAWVLKM